MRRSIRRSSGEERRKFVRLPYVLPVEFYLVSPDHSEYQSDLIQGFTRNVSRGGLCLEVNDLKESLALAGLSGKAELLLFINLPFNRHPVKVYGRAAWLKRDDFCPHNNRFILGVSYLDINLPETIRPVRFAKLVRSFHRLVAASLIILLFGLIVMTSSNILLRKNNRELVSKLVQSSEEKSKISRGIFRLEDFKEVLKEKFKETELQIANFKKEEKKGSLVNKAIVQKRLEAAYAELEDVKRRLKDLEEGEILLQKKLAEIKAGRKGLEEKTVKKMYSWLKLRQNRNTGLVLSYEGDPFLEDWAFTYDQALVAQCFLLFNDFKSAQKILDFYLKRAKKVEGGFTNAYDVSGGYVVEYMVHSGPNIWLGLAALMYVNKTGDKSYLPFVEDIANWVIAIQKEEPEGGVRGGPKVTWFSTEHNLDAYAFFKNLYGITGNKKYLNSSQKILTWLKKNAYMKAERRLSRGKGDATIATDTLSWSIAALGPALLKDEGMDPDDILEFAEENCKVTVDYNSPSGEKGKITGFDFAKARNIGRGGVISTEWTAQMISAFRIMSDFYRRQKNLKKAKLYQDKAEFFLAELDKLTINSASKTGQGAICLPYATHQNVDTGHGWRTPSGRNTGCIAGTAYAIFAKKNFNPFEIR